VVCETEASASLLRAVYGAFVRPAAAVAAPPALTYTISPVSGGGFVLRRGEQAPLLADDEAWLLFYFEKDLTIELQRRRRDLYFLHAAALERGGQGVLLVAESGGGKSTTTWGLLHHGFRYASDELAPIDVATGQVHGFPHALCLKTDPPAPYPLPPGVVRNWRAAHVPVDRLPCDLASGPLAPDVILFVRHRPELSQPVLESMGKAEAAARLYVQALNPLAHPADGLDAALEIVGDARCLSLATAALDASCALVTRELFGS